MATDSKIPLLVVAAPKVTEKEKAVAKESGASAFDRLVESNLELTKAVQRTVSMSYVLQSTQFVLVLMMIYLMWKR
jgi:hypothetical protein